MRAIVIGAGIGGTAATALLAHAGLDTTLLERNPRVGGSCSGYRKRGFHVDIGTHMFCRGQKGPLGDVLRRTGRPLAIRFARTRDIAEIRAIGHDGHLNTLAVPAALHRMPRFAWEITRALRLTPREAAHVGRLFGNILTMDDGEIRSWNDRTVEEFLRHHTDHERVLPLLGFLLGLYFVIPYWEVSAGEALWCFVRMARDNCLGYPIGGAVAVPTAYCRIAEEHGARVRTGAGVARILVEDGAVRGVETEDGEVLPAEIVVCTSSVRTTVLTLVGERHFPASYVEMARGIRGSLIAVQAKVALDRKLVSAGALVGGVGPELDLLRLEPHEYRAMYTTVTGGRVPDVVPFYCPVPTNFDPSLAPAGHQLLTVCVVAPTTDIPLVDAAPLWEEAMMRTLRRVVPGLDDHTLFVDRFSVAFMERWIGKEHGPAISTAQTPAQVGHRRPQVRTPIHGLYLAGCGAGAEGVGTELAAASAMECADRVLADLRRPVPATPTPRRRRRDRVLWAASRPIAWASRP